MGVDPTHNEPHDEPDPEVALARAVILTAIQDASGRPGANGTIADQRQARAFLVARTGEWAASRRAWCEVADIDPAWLCRHLRAQGLHEVEFVARARLPRSLTVRKSGPKPRTEPSEWDQRVLDWLRAEGHLPRFGRRRKADLGRMLDDAGFRTPKGGPVTRDTTFFFIERYADEFG